LIEYYAKKAGGEYRKFLRYFLTWTFGELGYQRKFWKHDKLVRVPGGGMSRLFVENGEAVAAIG